jgi:hypothetical protein
MNLKIKGKESTTAFAQGKTSVVVDDVTCKIHRLLADSASDLDDVLVERRLPFT